MKKQVQMLLTGLMLAVTSPVVVMAQASAETQAEKPASQPRVDIHAVIKEESRIPVLLEIARRAYHAKDYPVYEKVMTKLSILRPYQGQFRYRLAEALALQDKKSEAYNTLIQLTQQGLSFSMDGDDDFELIKGYEAYYYIQDSFNQAGKPQGRAQQYFSMGSADLMAESFAYDPVGDRFLIGSVRHRNISQVGESGKLEPYIDGRDATELLGVFALAIDAERKVLWVADAGTPHADGIAPSDYGKTGLVKYDLESGSLLQRYTFPVSQTGGRAGLVSHLTVGVDGTVYASDSVNRALYSLKPDAEAPAVLLMSPKFTSLRGVASHPAGDILYFADFELGLFAVSLKDNKVTQIKQGSTNLGGIDGIYWYEDSLIIIQNDINPQRVVRLMLDESGTVGFHAQVLIAGFEQMESPRVGGVMKDSFILIANSQLKLFDPISGKLLEGAELTEQTTLNIDLKYGWLPPRVKTAEEFQHDIDSQKESSASG